MLWPIYTVHLMARLPLKRLVRLSLAFIVGIGLTLCFVLILPVQMASDPLQDDRRVLDKLEFVESEISFNAQGAVIFGSLKNVSEWKVGEITVNALIFKDENKQTGSKFVGTLQPGQTDSFVLVIPYPISRFGELDNYDLSVRYFVFDDEAAKWQ